MEKETYDKLAEISAISCISIEELEMAYKLNDGGKMKIDILGTEYEVRESNKESDENLATSDGYCDTSIKLCVIDEMKDTEAGQKKNLPVYKNQVVRHEIIHAFLFESGLDACSWAQNEEMVDWIAMQFPKMLQAFQECDCL